MNRQVQDLICRLDETLQLCQANGAPSQVLEALGRSRELACSLSDELHTEPRKGPARSREIEWTFLDEAGDREILTRVYYDWDDYSPGDHVTPGYGGFAQVTDIEIREIQHYNSEGEPISREEYDQNLVWRLAEQSMGVLEDACTEAGYLSNAGQPRPLYFPGVSTPSESICPGGMRMAPSGRRRSQDQRSRETG